MKRIALIAIAAMLFQSATFALGPEITGSWYNQNESGHGFSIEYGDAGNGTPLVAVYWYVYDKDGNPVFLTGTGYPDSTGVDITFSAHYGMKFGTFDPGTHQERDGGVARFTFQDDKNGTFEYFPSVWVTENFGHSHHQMSITKLFAVTHPNVEPHPPTGEPVSLPGVWSGRMIYDRRSTGVCHDGNVVFNVKTDSRGYDAVLTIAVDRDGGGLSVYSFPFEGERIINLYLAEKIALFNEYMDINLRFTDYGQADGIWSDRTVDCYGTWSFQKE